MFYLFLSAYVATPIPVFDSTYDDLPLWRNRDSGLEEYLRLYRYMNPLAKLQLDTLNDMQKSDSLERSTQNASNSLSMVTQRIDAQGVTQDGLFRERATIKKNLEDFSKQLLASQRLLNWHQMEVQILLNCL